MPDGSQLELRSHSGHELKHTFELSVPRASGLGALRSQALRFVANAAVQHSRLYILMH